MKSEKYTIEIPIWELFGEKFIPLVMKNLNEFMKQYGRPANTIFLPKSLIPNTMFKCSLTELMGMKVVMVDDDILRLGLMRECVCVEEEK